MVKVVELWKEATRTLRENRHIAYVAIFRNKGEEIGVSLHHPPHGQLYALPPFIPLKVRLKIENSRRHFKKHGECLFCRILEEERKGGRVIYENDSFAVFLPFFASWPFELHVYPKRHVQYLTQLDGKESEDLADAVRATTATLNALFDTGGMPYTMMIFQAPFKGGRYPFYHLHIEFYPILRDANKVKFAAGIEMGTWEFTYDSVPEENAERLKEACGKIKEEKGLIGRCL